VTLVTGSYDQVLSNFLVSAAGIAEARKSPPFIRVGSAGPPPDITRSL
jgi:hypothetical protein